MIKLSLRFLSVFLIGTLILLPAKSWAQLVRGQYEDEAPLRTWNTFGLFTGGTLGMGGAHYAFASDLSTAMTNPSQLSRMTGLTVLVNGSLNSATLFKYSIINTGPTTTHENPSLALYSLDFGGISVNINGWGLALSTSILENYDRPPACLEYTASGSAFFKLDLEQTGILRNINLAVSKNLGSRIFIGLGFNFVTGDINKSLREDYYGSAVIMTDEKSHKLQGFYLNGGLTFKISKAFQAAAVFRTPYNKTSDSESLLRYEAAFTDTYIQIESQDDSSFMQPLIIGAGINYQFSDKFRAAADAAFFNWSKYKVTLFGEERQREFKDIVCFGTGIEYMSAARIFGLSFDLPLQLGFRYDPQPMKTPASRYFSVTFGTGLELDHFYFRAGASLGYENGSGDHLRGRRVALTLGYRRGKR